MREYGWDREIDHNMTFNAGVVHKRLGRWIACEWNNGVLPDHLASGSSCTVLRHEIVIEEGRLTDPVEYNSPLRIFFFLSAYILSLLSSIDL